MLDTRYLRRKSLPPTALKTRGDPGADHLADSKEWCKGPTRLWAQSKERAGAHPNQKGA